MNRIRRLPPLFWIGLLPVLLLWMWMRADSTRSVMAWKHCPSRLHGYRIMVYDSALHLG